MNSRYKDTPPVNRQTDSGDLDDSLLDDDEAADDLSDMDNMTDGDRQLTTDSDAIDGGLNDSDLGSEQGLTDAGESGAETADAGTI